MCALSFWQVSQRQWSEAKQMLSQALEGLDTLLGPQHPYCINAVEVLWRLCRRSGDLQRAEMLLSRLSAAASAASPPASRGFYRPNFSASEDGDGDGDSDDRGGDDDDEFGVREDSITMTLGGSAGKHQHLEEGEEEEEEEDGEEPQSADEEAAIEVPSQGSSRSNSSSRPSERRGRAAIAAAAAGGASERRRPTAAAAPAVRTRTFTSYRR
jgi:hypothetical protein